MDTLSIGLAFSRLGADVAGRQRPLWATAQDGSLVLVCQSTGFSRPSAGVLRYSAALSLSPGRGAQREAFRQCLASASTGSTPVRLIIQTPGKDGASSRIHVRADLLGNVAAFDGDAYSVDFVRPPEVEPERPATTRRKR